MNEQQARVIIGIGVLVIIVVAAFSFFTLFVSPAHAPGTEKAKDRSYTNSAYGYSFEYPEQYSVTEYTKQYVAVGTPAADDGFSSVAEVDVIPAEATDTEDASFTDFAHRQAELTCAADGPASSIDCPQVSRSQPFTSASGLSGEEFYLLQDTHSLASGTVAETERGPYYAFALSASSPYSLLLVRPPSAAEPDMIEDDTVTSIAKSLRVPGP